MIAATTVGCGVGAASGAGFLLGLSAVASEGEDGEQVQLGAAVLGGALVGLVSGCAAAAASSAIAPTQAWKRSRRELDPPRGQMPEHSPYYATGSAAGPMSITAVENGVRISWLGQPRKDQQAVTMRFYPRRTQAKLAACKEARLALDGQVSRYPLQHPTAGEAPGEREAVQLQAGMELFKAMEAAQVVVVDLCGIRLLLRSFARRALSQFNARFQQLAGQPRAVAAKDSAADTESSPGPVAGTTAAEFSPAPTATAAASGDAFVSDGPATPAGARAALRSTVPSKGMFRLELKLPKAASRQPSDHSSQF